jgi:hypothetical protein
MGALGPALNRPDVEHRAIEVDLIPPQVADLSRPQPVPEGEQDHSRVTMAGAVAFGRLDQALDLAERQVLAGAKIGVRSPGGRNCSENFSWRGHLECRICQ